MIDRATSLENEEQLRAVLLAAHEGIVLQARDGRILLWNRAAERVFGVADADIVDESALARDWGAVHEDGSPWPPAEHPSMRTLETGEPLLDQVMGVERGGEVRWISINTQPLLRPGETEPYAVVVSFSEITDRRHAEQALRESEEKYRSVVERASDSIVIGRDGRVVLANEAFASLSGFRLKELDGFPLIDLVKPEEKPVIAERAERRAAGERAPLVYELELTVKDGSTRIVEVRADRISYQGAPALLAVMRDRTERRRLEQELDDERRRFKELVEKSADAFLLTRPDGTIDFANQAACTMFGLAEQEFHAIGRQGVVDPTDPRLEKGLNERARTGRFVGELCLLRGDGTAFPAGVSSTVFTDHHGIERTTMVIRDLTETKAAEAELRRSEAMRDLSEHIVHLGSYRLDLATGRTTWSPEMYRLFDADPVDVDGDHAAILDARVHPDDRDAIAPSSATATATSVTGTTEYRVIWRDGSEHILHGGGVTEFAADGTALILTGYVQDVTEQRRAEAARLESEHAKSALLDRLNESQRLAGIGSWEWDLGSDSVWWSDETYRIFGVTPEDYVPGFEANGAFIHPDDAEEYRTAFAHSLRTCERLDWDLRLIAADGRLKYCNARGEVITDADGKPVRFVGTVLDITERKQIEEEIRRLNAELEARAISRTAQLETANKELEAFAYSVSHDLRAPLRAIDGFSQMVVEDAGDKLAGDDIRHLQRVRGAAQRMALLIDELLGLSRASRREMRVEEVDVSALASAVLDELREAQPERRVECVIATGLRAQADTVLLRVILENLLGNAWKFTSKHETARIEVGVVDASGERVLFVRDDGAGFDSTNAPHLFGAFQRMHAADAFEGDGIGLATVHRLVTRHGGRVWAEAEVERGATFYFTMPEPAESG